MVVELEVVEVVDKVVTNLVVEEELVDMKVMVDKVVMELKIIEPLVVVEAVEAVAL